MGLDAESEDLTAIIRAEAARVRKERDTRGVESAPPEQEIAYAPHTADDLAFTPRVTSAGDQFSGGRGVDPSARTAAEEAVRERLRAAGIDPDAPGPETVQKPEHDGLIEARLREAEEQGIVVEDWHTEAAKAQSAEEELREAFAQPITVEDEVYESPNDPVQTLQEAGASFDIVVDEDNVEHYVAPDEVTTDTNPVRRVVEETIDAVREDIKIQKAQARRITHGGEMPKKRKPSKRDEAILSELTNIGEAIRIVAEVLQDQQSMLEESQRPWWRRKKR